MWLCPRGGVVAWWRCVRVAFDCEENGQAKFYPPTEFCRRARKRHNIRAAMLPHVYLYVLRARNARARAVSLVRRQMSWHSSSRKRLRGAPQRNATMSQLIG